jgi:hypothetical protein
MPWPQRCAALNPAVESTSQQLVVFMPKHLDFLKAKTIGKRKKAGRFKTYALLLFIPAPLS